MAWEWDINHQIAIIYLQLKHKLLSQIDQAEYKLFSKSNLQDRFSGSEGFQSLIKFRATSINTNWDLSPKDDLWDKLNTIYLNICKDIHICCPDGIAKLSWAHRNIFLCFSKAERHKQLHWNLQINSLAKMPCVNSYLNLLEASS